MQKSTKEHRISKLATITQQKQDKAICRDTDTSHEPVLLRRQPMATQDDLSTCTRLKECETISSMQQISPSRVQKAWFTNFNNEHIYTSISDTLAMSHVISAYQEYSSAFSCSKKCVYAVICDLRAGTCRKNIILQMGIKFYYMFLF